MDLKKKQRNKRWKENLIGGRNQKTQKLRAYAEIFRNEKYTITQWNETTYIQVRNTDIPTKSKEKRILDSPNA